ncbi:RNA deprotection pyrophosphohydrolase [Staphylococcus sp. 11261D007BR]
MRYRDKYQQQVELTYRSDGDEKTGSHVLALPIYRNQLLFTKHKRRGIEFPGGKCEAGEKSEQGLERELYEETGASIQDAYYIAQYSVNGTHNHFNKDVYVVFVDRIECKEDYLETNGPILYHTVEDIPEKEKSELLKDRAILQCVERMMELGFYR